jgi:hypothetical protein
VATLSPASFFRDEELAILGLNTARSFARKNGRVSIEQIAMIERVFREIPDRIFKALVTHHPLGLPSGQRPLELAGRARLALKALGKVGVQLLLSGHHHQSWSGGLSDIGGDGSVLVLHAGTAISTRTRGEGNTYNLITIAGQRVTVVVMEWTMGHGFGPKRTSSYIFHHRKWQPD